MDQSSREDMQAALTAIKESDLSEVDKVLRAFDWVARRQADHGQAEIERLRALNDRESIVKERIRLATMQHARQILQDCYRLVLGRGGWDEQD